MPRPNVPKNPTKPNGHDKHLAYIASMRQRAPSLQTQGESCPPVFITVIFDSQCLSVRLKAVESSTSKLFTGWQDSQGVLRDRVPAVIAYDDSESAPLWGFQAQHHPKRIENVRSLLESRISTPDGHALVNSSGKKAPEVVCDFLKYTLQHVLRYHKSRAYTFVIPSRWSEREIGLYAEAIKVAIPEERFTFLHDIEAGVFWMFRHLRTISCKAGILFLNNAEEPDTSVRRVAYLASDAPSQLKQLPGSITIDNDGLPFHGLVYPGIPREVQQSQEEVYITVFEGPGSALARFIQANPPPRDLNSAQSNSSSSISEISRDEAISTADESLTHDTPNQPSIRRRLKKSYGVNSRVEFNENEHDSAHKVKDYDGSLWCNNIIRWMAYKDDLLDSLDPDIRKRFRQEFEHTGPFIAKECLYELDACENEISTRPWWYNNTPGMLETARMEADIGRLQHRSIIGHLGGNARQYEQFNYQLRLSFGDNGVLTFVLESLSGQECCQITTAFSTIEQVG